MSVAGLYNCGNGSNGSIVHVGSTVLQHIGVHAAFLAVGLVFIVLYGIDIFRFRFLFCWYLGFFFPVPLPVKVGGSFSRSVPSLYSRVYFMYTSYFVRGHLLCQ